MDLNLLSVFEALMEELNVTRAASRVGLSQSAMSNALKRLRDSFGDPLFTRSAKGMVATQRACELEVPIKEALRLIRIATESNREFDPQTSTRKFSISTTDYIELVLMPALLHSLGQAANLKMEILSLLEGPHRQLQEGRVDLAIGHFTELPDTLFQTELYKEDFVCVVNKTAPFGASLSLKQFTTLKHVIVSPWGGVTGLVDEILSQKNQKRTVVLSTPAFLVAPALIENTDYVVTLPRRLAESFCEKYRIKILEHPLSIPPLHIRMVWHSRTQSDPAYIWLRGVIRTIFDGKNRVKLKVSA